MPDDVPSPERIYVPVPSDRAWLDPKLIVSIFETTINSYVVPSNAPYPLAPPDPTRALVGFTLGTTLTVFGEIGPWSQATGGSAALISGKASTFFTLREHLTLPTLGWYAINCAGMTVTVTQVRRS